MSRGWGRRAAAALALGAWLGLVPTVHASAEPESPPAASEPAEAEPARATSPVVSDGPVAVTTRLSPDPSNVGDLLVLEIIAAYPRDVRVNLPTRMTFDPLHHVRTVEGEAEPTGDGLRKTFRVELQCFEVGEAEIPGFPLTYVDAEGQVHTVQVPARPFVVESLLVNEDDPQRKGEDPPISREYPDTLAEIVIWATLSTLLLALVAWLVMRRLWRRDRSEPAPPPIPAHELALTALDELERGELLEQGEVQRYYVELTEIAKGYIERRFRVDALDRTTEEIRAELRRDGSRVAPLSAEDVVEFLEECDLVKFARLQPPETEARAALGTVREMVEESIATGEPEPEPDAKEAEGDDAPKGETAEDDGASQAEAEAPPEPAAPSEVEVSPEPVASEAEASSESPAPSTVERDRPDPGGAP